jgi:hypothetical protein
MTSQEENESSSVSIGDVTGGIHGSVIAGRDATNLNMGRAADVGEGDPVAESSALWSLRETLASLYPTEEDGRRIAQDSGLNVSHINFSTKPVNFWNNILVEAHRHDRVKAVVAAASFEYPERAEELRQAYQAHSSSS